MYSQDAGDGPISTSFAFFDNDKLELIGSVTEGEASEDYDPNFEATLRFFKSEADFTQRIKLLTQDTTLIKGEFEFINIDKILKKSSMSFHFYGKKVTKPNRKLGHITMKGDKKDKILNELKKVKSTLKIIEKT